MLRSSVTDCKYRDYEEGAVFWRCQYLDIGGWEGKCPR